jgi:hypothetical protein
VRRSSTTTEVWGKSHKMPGQAPRGVNLPTSVIKSGASTPNSTFLEPGHGEAFNGAFHELHPDADSPMPSREHSPYQSAAVAVYVPDDLIIEPPAQPAALTWQYPRQSTDETLSLVVARLNSPPPTVSSSAKVLLKPSPKLKTASPGKAKPIDTSSVVAASVTPLSGTPTLSSGLPSAESLQFHMDLSEPERGQAKPKSILAQAAAHDKMRAKVLPTDKVSEPAPVTGNKPKAKPRVKFEDFS